MAILQPFPEAVAAMKAALLGAEAYRGHLERARAEGVAAALVAPPAAAAAE